MVRNSIFVTQVKAQHCVKAKNHVKQVLTVSDEAFGGPEAQSFDGPYSLNKNQCRVVSP